MAPTVRSMLLYLKFRISQMINASMNGTVNNERKTGGGTAEKRISFSFVYFLCQSADRPEFSSPLEVQPENRTQDNIWVTPPPILVAWIFFYFLLFWILLSGVEQNGRVQRHFLALFFLGYLRTVRKNFTVKGFLSDLLSKRICRTAVHFSLAAWPKPITLNSVCAFRSWYLRTHIVS